MKCKMSLTANFFVNCLLYTAIKEVSEDLFLLKHAFNHCKQNKQAGCLLKFKALFTPFQIASYSNNIKGNISVDKRTSFQYQDINSYSVIYKTLNPLRRANSGHLYAIPVFF